jgi:ribosomal protein L21E
MNLSKTRKIRVGDIAQFTDRYTLTNDENEGKIMLVTKLIDSSAAGDLIEVLLNTSLHIFPAYLLERLND